MTVIPYTSQARGTRFEVPIATSFLSGGVFDAQNPLTTNHAKFLRKIGILSLDQLEQVENAVRQWLGL
jgi:mRNA interferase MazF